MWWLFIFTAVVLVFGIFHIKAKNEARAKLFSTLMWSTVGLQFIVSAVYLIFFQ